MTSPSKDSKTLLFDDKPTTVFGIRYSPIPSPAYFVHGLSLFMYSGFSFELVVFYLLKSEIMCSSRHIEIN